jgi:hypothetical protein
MKESIGTTWIFTIVIAFIALFASYLAFSVNYSKSFRVKDGIVERINKHNGFNKQAVDDINELLGTINYNARGDCYRWFDSNSTDESVDALATGDYHYAGVSGTDVSIDSSTRNQRFNYCVMRVMKPQSSRADIQSVYYKVIVFYSLQIGNITLGSQFRTTGETQTMYFPNDDYLGD